MTDEGDHGGTPVIDGPLGTAAPTKFVRSCCAFFLWDPLM